jgi:hypothetical protein
VAVIDTIAPARKRPWHHWLRPVLALVFALLVGGLGATPASAVPTPAASGRDYQLRKVPPGDPMHIPILIYRFRHTEDLASQVPAGDQATANVTWDRNVADFMFTEGGKTYIVVAPSVSRFGNATTVAAIDILRVDNPATGQFTVVDPHLRPLVDAQGRPAGNWRTSWYPSDRWDVKNQPAIDAERKSKGLHSERLAERYFELVVKPNNPTATAVEVGLSEQIPCEGPTQCKTNLEDGKWFPELKDMRYLSEENRKKPAQAVQNEMMKVYDTWTSRSTPTGSDASAQLGYHEFTVPGDDPAQGPASQALAPGTDPGGIDFSTLELRYLAEGQGGKLAYAFDASATTAADHKITEGRTALAQSSDAFFVWLSLSPSTFWVNLNPTEPDRIVDPRLGKTDVGRILLQADFQMKKVVGKLIHPDSPLGKQFWGSSDPTTTNCISMRQWIVPLPATVYEQNGGLYILDAPLDVKMETDYLQAHGETDTSCTHPDAHMESVFRTLVLPKVKEAINGAPEFAELRRVYLSRVAAEWYRQRHSVGGALSNMINSGDVSNWPALQSWSPRTVFDQYVDSYKKKEFNVTRRVKIGNDLYDETYTYGGVDFSQVKLSKLAQSTFQQNHPDLAGAVQQSFQRSAPDQHGRIWLGGTSQPLKDQKVAAATAPSLGTFLGWLAAVLAIIVIVIVALAVLVIWLSGRGRRPRPPAMTRSG